MGKVLLHARVTPATGGCSDTKVLSCTEEGYLNVHTDTSISGASGALSENLKYLGDQAIALGSGAISAGTQRFTIATDDSNIVKMVTALEIMDDWDDGSDRCETKLGARYSLKGTPVVTAAVTTVEKTILPWLDTLGMSFLEIGVLPASVALTSVKVYKSPTGADATQQEITTYQDPVEALSQTCSAGVQRTVMVFDLPPSYVKVTATSGTSTGVTCYPNHRV